MPTEAQIKRAEQNWLLEPEEYSSDYTEEKKVQEKERIKFNSSNPADLIRRAEGSDVFFSDTEIMDMIEENWSCLGEEIYNEIKSKEKLIPIDIVAGLIETQIMLYENIPGSDMGILALQNLKSSIQLLNKKPLQQ